MRKRVYISGPISLGDPTGNFARFSEAFFQCVHNGYAPFNPGLTMCLPGNGSLNHEAWLAIDLPWVAVSDVVLRLPGESKGADEECGYAKSLGIPVFGSMEELNKYLWKK
jgi:hypothetical protein